MKTSIAYALRAFALASMAVLPAGCASADDDAEASADQLNWFGLDDYAKAFFHNDALEPRVNATPVESSPFPYACPECDVSGHNPITNLVDARMVNAVRGYTCATGEDHRFIPYFPGIQAFNDDGGIIGSVRTKLAGDKALANLYLKYGVRTVSEPASHVASWSALNYFNAGSVHADTPGVPLFLSQADGNPEVGIRSMARANHSPLRLKEGPDYREGDQVEARLVGIWASTAKDEDFISQSPEFYAQGDMAERDRRDFEHFRTIKDDRAWIDFMYRATYEVATAFKCNGPIVAHSGGGAVVGWIMRLLSVSELKNDIKGKYTGFGVVGLEAVLSEQTNARFNNELGVNTTQFVVGDHGSKTYDTVIAKECAEIGSTPLHHVPVFGNIDPPGWNGDGGGHGGLGFFTLQFGRIADQVSFTVGVGKAAGRGP